MNNIEFIKNGFKLGESPFWDNDSKRLYWVDILGKTIFYLENEEIFSLPVEEFVSYIGKTNENNLIIAFESNISIYSKNLEFIKEIHRFPKDNFRCNDGEITPSGNLLIGRMNNGYNDGSIPFTFDGHLHFVSRDSDKIFLPEVSIPNGIVFSNDKTRMYYIDSLKQELVSFQYDSEKETISNMRSEFKTTEGFMDGMCSDVFGNLYIALYGGSKVIVYSTVDCKLVDEILLENQNISCCAFGGPEMNELYITSASDNKNSGSLVKVKLNVKGRELYSFIE